VVREEYERILRLTDEVGKAVDYEDLQRALVNAERDVGEMKYNLIPGATTALRATTRRKYVNTMRSRLAALFDLRWFQARVFEVREKRGAMPQLIDFK